MAPKRYNKLAILGIAAVMIIVLSLILYVSFTVTTAKGVPKTPLTPTSGSSGSGLGVSAQVWQSLYIVPTTGQPYWVEPGQTYSAMTVYGSPSGSGTDFSQVQVMHNEIDVNPSLQGQTVASWTFSCQETIEITDQYGNSVGYVTQPGSSATAMTVNAQGSTLTPGQNNWIAGASETGSQLQATLNSAGATAGSEYYIVITLSNIQLTLNFQGGGYQTLSGTSGTAQNQASWLVKIT